MKFLYKLRYLMLFVLFVYTAFGDAKDKRLGAIHLDYLRYSVSAPLQGINIDNIYGLSLEGGVIRSSIFSTFGFQYGKKSGSGKWIGFNESVGMEVSSLSFYLLGHYLIVTSSNSEVIPYIGLGVEYRGIIHEYTGTKSVSLPGYSSHVENWDDNSFGFLGSLGLFLGPVDVRYVVGRVNWISVGLVFSI